METYSNTPQNNPPKQGGFNMNIILKICGALAVVFLMFLPVAGYNGTNQANSNGIDIIFNSTKNRIDEIFNGDPLFLVMLIFFILSVSCGIAIIFFRKPLLFMIFATLGIISFLTSYLIIKSKDDANIIELKIGAFLAIMSYIAIIVLSIIQKATANKQPIAIMVPPPQVTRQPQYSQQSQYIPPPPPPPVQQQQPPRPKFCTKCGNKFPDNYQGKFCTSCGVRVLDV